MNNDYAQDKLPAYCNARYASKRRVTREVFVGNVALGGTQPIRVQSMTTTNTEDVNATVAQTLELAEAGCEIVRITAPSNAASRALQEIAAKVRAAKCEVPLVADIHFLPSAAMEAIEHVEKVRVNPGNYADKKRFKTREYTDAQYQEELERLHEAFSPLVLRAKELGRALRIGTNHGSLSDRIMNRYGDSPQGMVESALEFVRICESHGFRNLVLSLKASNPKVMIAAYRLAAAKMSEEGMDYPLHLGVTEAGDGEDARIKSAIGIGSLLYDGLGDTIRVSLTEDPVYEIPVAKNLADKAMKLWEQKHSSAQSDSLNPYDYIRRLTYEIPTSGEVRAGAAHPPRAWVCATGQPNKPEALAEALTQAQAQLSDCVIEGIITQIDQPKAILTLAQHLAAEVHYIVLELQKDQSPNTFSSLQKPQGKSLVYGIENPDTNLNQWIEHCESTDSFLALNCDESFIQNHASALKTSQRLIFTRTAPDSDKHPLGSYRSLAEALQEAGIRAPLWIRCTQANSMHFEDMFSARLLEDAMLAGSLFCDGIGDFISIETEDDLARSAGLAYNILQGSRMRISRTEYVACPSCGRTLFDLQSTTQKIRSRTGHLKGVTIAVMGCIVNGPGEMADADFGYVGGAPGKVNLYVGKTVVKKNIPEAEAVDRLVDLIAEHGKWVEPKAALTH